VIDAARASFLGMSLAEYRRAERARLAAARTHRARVIAALGLEPEGRTPGDCYAATTAEFERDLAAKRGRAG